MGAAIGWLLGNLLGTVSKVGRIEDVLVGVFGAFIGGEFLADMVMGTAAVKGFTMGAFAMAVLGAVAAMGLLALMRRSVGPLAPHKKRGGDR